MTDFILPKGRFTMGANDWASQDRLRASGNHGLRPQAVQMPLRDSTRGLFAAENLHSLLDRCLVLLVTRAEISDMTVLRERVLNEELALAADVFDPAPLPPDDPLLGHANIVHTPHNAGRTVDANHSYAELLAEQFLPVVQARTGKLSS